MQGFWINAAMKSFMHTCILELVQYIDSEAGRMRWTWNFQLKEKKTDRKAKAKTINIINICEKRKSVAEIKKQRKYIHSGSITIQMKRWRDERQEEEEEVENEEYVP